MCNTKFVLYAILDSFILFHFVFVFILFLHFHVQLSLCLLLWFRSFFLFLWISGQVCLYRLFYDRINPNLYCMHVLVHPSLPSVQSSFKNTLAHTLILSLSLRVMSSNCTYLVGAAICLLHSGEERHLEEPTETVLINLFTNRILLSHANFDESWLIFKYKIHKGVLVGNAASHWNMTLHVNTLNCVWNILPCQSAAKGLSHMRALWLFQITDMHFAGGRVDYKSILSY